MYASVRAKPEVESYFKNLSVGARFMPRYPGYAVRTILVVDQRVLRIPSTVLGMQPSVKSTNSFVSSIALFCRLAARAPDPAEEEEASREEAGVAIGES